MGPLVAVAACAGTATNGGAPGSSEGVDASVTAESDASTENAERADASADARGADAPRADARGDAVGPTCVPAGQHRLPGTDCCPGDGAGSVAELSLCCHGAGGSCDTTKPNPDAFCCFPHAKCNVATGQCEARSCWNATDNCLLGALPCCDNSLACDPRDAGPFPTSKRCCRPDGMEPPPGKFDCCNTQLHTDDKGKIVCGSP